MDVVEWKDMEQAVFRAIIPGLEERARLCGEDGLREDHTFLYSDVSSSSSSFFRRVKEMRCKHTGLLVVPEVYNIIPPSSDLGSSNVMLSPDFFPFSIFSTTTIGFRTTSSLTTSSAFSLNFSDVSKTIASLFSTT